MDGTARRTRRRAARTIVRKGWAFQRSMGPRVRMLIGSAVVMFTVWLFMPVPALTAYVPPPSRAAALPMLPWLSTSGQRIVDPQGRTVLLRGFNTDVLLESTVQPTPFDATDAELIHDNGFDVVRLPIAWSLLEPQRGVFSTAYLDRIASLVSMINAHGLYVVLDMHSLGWSPAYGGSGAPDWATVRGVPDPVWGPMPSALRLLSPAINVSTAYFWLTSDWQTQFLDTWQFVAARFRDDSGVAGYDIFNEPHSFPLPPFRFDKDQLFPFYQRAIDALGATDPNHIFFIENDMTGDIPTSVVPLSAPDLVYAPHVYTGSLIPPAFNGDGSGLRTHVDELAGEAAAVPAALWFGEFSIDIHSAHGTTWVQDILDDFDAHDAGWAWWQWRESSGYGVRSADGSTLDLTTLHLLARPYLAAAPPGITFSGSNGDPGALTVTVAAAHGAAPAEVAWPQYTLGAPTVTSTCAAAWSWSSQTERVSLDVAAGEACVLQLRAA